MSEPQFTWQFAREALDAVSAKRRAYLTRLAENIATRHNGDSSSTRRQLAHKLPDIAAITDDTEMAAALEHFPRTVPDVVGRMDEEREVSVCEPDRPPLTQASWTMYYADMGWGIPAGGWVSVHTGALRLFGGVPLAPIPGYSHPGPAGSWVRGYPRRDSVESSRVLPSAWCRRPWRPPRGRGTT